ncbi:MAG: hypothetical protein M1832_003523 [Thelocarpon impressellum]|nr:MAG: hypothetical protein M1832_003523 [Thelocarpon impressellum]
MAYQSQYSQYRPPQAHQANAGAPPAQLNPNGRQGSLPQVRATFTPGGVDDFYMPEVISPAPQRIMPEVPENIQENLAHLELEANPPRNADRPASTYSESGSTFSSYRPPRHSSLGAQGGMARPPPNEVYEADDGYARRKSNGYADPYTANAAAPPATDYRAAAGAAAVLDQPSFSPFPRLVNAPVNVPPSDEDREATLEHARVPVLNSNDPEMQLAWAQDALAYVEVALQNEQRVSEHQPPRPQTPQVEHQLRVDALSIVSFLAEQHHPKAEFMKGMWLEFGKFGYRVDKKEAFRCYHRAAEKGYARAEYRMGMQYESSNDQAKAIRHYDRGVALGDSASHYRLGMMTLLGQHGEKQDFPRGVQLIKYAAQNADENAPQGAYVYGMLQAHELDHINVPELFLPLDFNGARANIEKAAYLGFAKAQLKMGTAYELCQLGCDFNPELSLHYNALAARQGEPEADMAISKWFLCGYEGAFEKNEELAYVYAQRAAQSGLATAEFAMGYFHEIGMYVPADLKEARRWYESAAEHGNKDAAGRIEGISRSKTLSKSDHEDVAIAKIKSQYGSQRGKRPERFKNPSAPLATIEDERIDFPDPSRPRLSVDAGSPYPDEYGQVQPPPRSASAAPYPLEDPHLDGGRRQSNGGGFINPAVRPSSAFGINPNIHGAPVSPLQSPPVGAGGFYRGGPASQPGLRPVSSADNFAVAGGRGGPPPGRGGRGAANRPAPLTYHSAGAALSGRPAEDPAKSQAPRLDIGFSAPADPAADKRHRLQKPQRPAASASPQLRPHGGSESALSPASSGSASGRTPTSPYAPVQHGGQKPLAPLAPHAGLGPAPGSRPGSRTHSPGSRPSSAGKVGQKPSTPQPSPGAAAPAPAAAAAPRPPGKGPKTFEEMGVPQAPKENECTVM